MLTKKRLFIGALAGGIAAFFVFKGDRLTAFFGAIAAFFGAFSVNEIVAIVGVILGVASFFLTWYYKEKNHLLLKAQLMQQGAVSAILKQDDAS
ncbi:hypothetical protein DDM60_002669 [Vibrio cholerae]|nr:MULTISPECIES: holin [Vibrio]ELJ8564054.1 hypothetical protein [Vibrio cholerae]MBY4642226.1 phage holin family protein [Vibrio cholerae]MCR9658498.1 phage holin family protein [Vibrio cholerae]MCR9689179.1 phage holin family protein [Vibrio cholerae]MCR9746511.1 phage holin family protein [Vibrio cholerae]